MKIALTIAGSDSGGGAGIQADLKTFQQFGVYGTSVIVALTAQNTNGIRAVHTVAPDFVEAQLSALAEDLPPNAVKTGMLATPELVRLVAKALVRYRWNPFVLDPVMIATSGDRLLATAAEQMVRDELVPRATVVTPNLDEAAVLTGLPVRDEADMVRAGERLLELGAGAVLVKGGHLASDRPVDVLVTPAMVRRFEHRRIATRSTHGTGCTVSAALTAGLALGRPLETATEHALDFVQRAIAAAPGLGSGHGPVNHSIPATIPSSNRATRSPA